jgi:hypothetical protein
LGLRKSRVVLFRVDLRMRPGSEAIDVIGGVVVALVTGIVVFRSDICSLILTRSGPEFVTASGRLSASDTAVGCIIGTYSNAVAGGVVTSRVPFTLASSTFGGKTGPI